VGGCDCGGHDRLDVSRRLAWGRIMVHGKEVESHLTSVVERGLSCPYLGNHQLTRRRGECYRPPTESKELAETKAVASLNS
jgi:hypothetical protein